MILVTGSLGQIGVDLIRELVLIHGPKAIVATDLREPASSESNGVTFKLLDVTDADALNQLFDDNAFDTVYHLAGILSATGEEDPDLCWKVNIEGLENVLKSARERSIRVFWPSSIAVFGSSTEKSMTRQSARTDPYTMYGVTKTAGELLCRYYARKFAVDVRSLRFPGVISYAAPPGGGTTDYAVEMFFGALQHGSYECFVSEDTRLPMMYIPDAVKSVLELMQVDPADISIRTSYNVTAFSFSAQELASAITKHIPEFRCTYTPDSRQIIADSWPRSIDDSTARKDWGWKPEFNLEGMVSDMLKHISAIRKHESSQESL